MALYLPKESPDGVTSSYWRVTGVSWSVISKTLEVEVCIYLDKSARDADKLPTSFRRFTFEDVVELDGDPRVKAYELMKTLEEFAEAVDF